MRSVSKISSSTFYIRRHPGHRCVYFMRIILFYILVWCFIYFCRFASTRFWLVHVTEKSLYWIFRFWKICDPVILQSTSEARIWFSTVTSNTFIFRVVWIKGWTKFLIYLSFYLLLKIFQLGAILHNDWILSEKICSLCSSYRIIQILVINF